MKHLYFTRHGLSTLNAEGKFSGSLNPPLTIEGRAQATAAGQLAKNLGIDTIVSSPKDRAIETAQLIAKEIGYDITDIHLSDLVVERHFGELEGQPYAPDLDLDGMSDIETTDSLLERARLTARWLNTLDAETVLVVSHGAFGRALRSIYKPDHDFSERLPNATIVQFL
jgi:broad specificity phosphatase PhoE